jgi:hypothetical protein
MSINKTETEKREKHAKEPGRRKTATNRVISGANIKTGMIIAIGFRPLLSIGAMWLVLHMSAQLLIMIRGNFIQITHISYPLIHDTKLLALSTSSALVSAFWLQRKKISTRASGNSRVLYVDDNLSLPKAEGSQDLETEPRTGTHPQKRPFPEDTRTLKLGILVIRAVSFRYSR